MLTGQKTAYEAASANLENMMTAIAGRSEVINRTVLSSRLEVCYFLFIQGKGASALPVQSMLRKER